jgi:xylulokinase
VHGLQITHSPAHLLCAVAEAAGFVVRHGVEILDPPTTGRPPAPVVCGGGAVGDKAAQLRADVLGRPIERTGTADVTSLGAAVLAAAGSAVHPGLAAAWKQMRPPTRTFLPDRDRAAAFDDVYRRWLAAEGQGWGENRR